MSSYAFFLPQVIDVLGVYCLFLAFRKTPRIRWKYVLLGMILIAIHCGLLGAISGGTDGLGAVIGFLNTLFGSIVIFFSGIVLLTVLPGKRKWVGVLVIIILPTLYISSVFLGDHFSKINRDRDAVVKAINKYHVQNGIYPESLDELVPEYIEDLRSPLTTWGWLYLAETDQFSFGYVDWIDKMGYSVCVYSSYIPEWDCLPNETGPFQLGPTPMP